MAKELTGIELHLLEAQSANLMRAFETDICNINMMAETNATRELSMVRTKIDEAMMWLERYQAGVCVDLAHKVCR